MIEFFIFMQEEAVETKYGIRGDLTVLLNGVEYKPQEEESAVANALANLFESTVGRHNRFPGLTRLIRSIQKGFLSGAPVSDILTESEIADILSSAEVYQNKGGAMLDMENILNLRLHREGGATYIWEKKKGRDHTTCYWLRG